VSPYFFECAKLSSSDSFPDTPLSDLADEFCSDTPISCPDIVDLLRLLKSKWILKAAIRKYHCVKTNLFSDNSF
jgi:hypothetical protein